MRKFKHKEDRSDKCFPSNTHTHTQHTRRQTSQASSAMMSAAEENAHKREGCQHHIDEHDDADNGDGPSSHVLHCAKHKMNREQ